MTEINKRVREIADQVKSSTVFSSDFLGINIDATNDDTHINFKINKAVYENNLPNDITLETIKNLKEYNSDFEAGVVLGIGEATLSIIENNPKITSSTGIVNKEPDSFISTRINTEDSFFSFESHVRECMPIERLTGELTQKQLVRRHLTKLYINSLCKAISNIEPPVTITHF